MWVIYILTSEASVWKKPHIGAYSQWLRIEIICFPSFIYLALKLLITMPVKNRNKEHQNQLSQHTNTVALLLQLEIKKKKIQQDLLFVLFLFFFPVEHTDTISFFFFFFVSRIFRMMKSFSQKMELLLYNNIRIAYFKIFIVHIEQR